MATPYYSTPRIPVPPNSTPLSATAYTHPNSKVKRPPIHNPYDKFTQPEFDAWIGDITGALKRALGQIEADVEPKPHEHTQVSTGNATAGYRPIDLDESEDEAVNDSFAEIKARHALGKGKARDPREGPGLGGADRTKPIEIVSSDEEEEQEVELSIEVDNDSSDEGEDEDYSEQEEDYSWKRGQSSSQQIYSPHKRRQYVQEEGSEEDDSEEGSEEGGEEDLTTRKYRPTEVIDIVSDDEDEMDHDRRDRGYREEEGERGAEELEDESEGTGEEYSEEEPVRLGTSHPNFQDARISISRDSRHFHYADEEETKDETKMVEDDDVIEEIQPPEDNTTFPPQVLLSPVNRHIEIRDPWAGPRIYAEDNYTGGDVPPSPDTCRDPHHLGDYDSYEIEEIIPDVTDGKVDADGMHITEQDTPRKSHNQEQERPVDISVPCLGLQTYAEDFYAGGDIRVHPGQEIDPSLMEGTVRDDIRMSSASEIVAPDEQDYEEGLVEDELEHENEAVIQPPTQHAFTSASRLALPVPASAEFVSIADSDEEPGSADQEPIKLGPPEVVDVELQHEDDEQNLQREQFLDVDEIIKEDMHPTAPLGPTPPSEAEISVATCPPSGSSDQQDGMSADQYESLYANIEAVAVQTEEQAEVISTLVNWNYPPAFPAGIPTYAPGHLATPSSEESNADVEDSAELDTEIDPPELVNKETSPLPLVHEQVITQGEMDLDKAPAKNTETLVHDVALSITEAALVEDSEPQLRSPTLIVDPSSSHMASNDLVHDARIAEHDKVAMAKEATQGRKIEVGITSEGVTQLADEDSVNDLAPAQLSTEDIVDDEIGSRDVNASIQETEIHMGVNGLPVSVVRNPQVAATQDDILSSAEGINEQIDTPPQPFASTSSAQIPVLVHNAHQYDYDQLPTPPPDQSPTVQSPSVANDGTSSSPKFPSTGNKVEIQEVQDEDDIRPQPFLADSVEFDLRIDNEPDSEPEYIVVEPEPDHEYADEDADGEIDVDVEDVSMRSASHMWDEVQIRNGEMQLSIDYVVEEPLADGRLTEEPRDRAHSLGIVSVEPEESEAHCANSEIFDMHGVPFFTDEELLPLDFEGSSQVETNIQPQTSSHPSLEEPTDSSGPPTLAMHVIPGSISPAGERIVPMPVAADANVVDPTKCLDSVSPIPVASDVQPQAQRRVPSDGLFIPADESTTVTPARPPESIHHQLLNDLAHVFFGTPVVSSTPVAELGPVSTTGLLSEIGLVIDQAVEQIEVPQSLQLPPIDAAATHISEAHVSGNMHVATSRDGPISVPISPPLRDLTVSTHVALTRKPTDPILVSDPYPYSLSTPGVSLMDPTEEDTEHDNSMSSNSTGEKDLEDKDTNNILDDGDELELQYPPELDVLADLNIAAATKGEETSKIVDEVVDADADGEFDPEFAVTRLSQPSVESQPEASSPKLITSDSTVAPGPGPSNEVQNNDVSPREIPIDPVKGTSSGDFPLTETANLPETSTTPLTEIVGTSSSTQASKRKRDSSPLPNNVAAAIEKVGKRKNKKVAKLAGKGKTKATNHEVVDQMTSRATIRVKPRPKTQSVESVARPALSKNPSEVSSRSSSGASATFRILRPSSRSSSVASSVPSDQSVAVAVPPSPTVHKPNVPLAQTLQHPISLFHAHGQRRNNQTSQPQPNQSRAHPTQLPRPSIQRVISLPRINDSGPTAATSPTTTITPTVVTPPTANIQTASSPTVRHAPVMPSSSLVTRSHCRYHRISLPREEGGPRVCFLVPGCSLNDKELMAEEEIEDHGDATHGDSLRMIKDIQSLDFDSYLIGILRQLVGLDILREQEVFYLPQPGEEVVRKPSPRKERSGLFRGADSSSYAGSPGYSGSVRSPTSMKAPASVADSTSTSLSAFRRRMGSEKDSASAFSDTESEPSDEELPDVKRARPSLPDEQGSAGPMGPPLKAQGKRKLKGRRSKQIDVSYQPEETREDNSDDAQFGNRRKKSKRGVKRRRGSEITAKDTKDTKDGGDERILKKIKIRRSAPIPQALAVGDSTT